MRRPPNKEIVKLASSLGELLVTGSEYAVPEKRAEYEVSIYRELIGTTERVAKLAIKSANGNSAKLRAAGLASRSRVEATLRRLQLRYPSTEEEFHAALKWSSEMGGEDELLLIEELRLDPPFSSKASADLINVTKESILRRRNIEPPTLFGGLLKHRHVSERQVRAFAWAVLLSSAAMAGVGFVRFPSTMFGFALVFGSSVIGYEVYLLLRML